MDLEYAYEYYTDLDNVVVAYNVNGFDFITTNYYDEQILINILDGGECIAICNYTLVHDRHNYNIIQNTKQIDLQLLDVLMQKFTKQLQENA